LDNQDALQQIAQAIRDVKAGAPKKSLDRQETLKSLAFTISQALEGKDQKAFQILGQEIGSEIAATLGRLSVLRSLFEEKTLQIGEETKLTLPSDISMSLQSDGCSPQVLMPMRELYTREQYVTELLQLKPEFSVDELEEALDTILEKFLKKEEGMAKSLLRASAEYKKEILPSSSEVWKL
jgi:hypothetical protein